MERKNFKLFSKETGLFIADILYNAVIIAILVILIRSFLISPFKVLGSSMEDTLQNKEFILIDKISYLIGDIERGDPIVFLPPITSRDTPKFEKVVTVDSSGMGTFDFKGLSKNKGSNFCQKFLARSLWFCKESIQAEDIVYFTPQKETLNSTKEIDWEQVKTSTITKKEESQGFFEIKGEPGQTFTVRIYNPMGSEYFVKRVIGVPGDTVKIDNGRVYLKGHEDEDFFQIDESFLNEENLNKTFINSLKHRQNVYEVPEGEYFVMGDNRNHSNDSRGWLEPITQEPSPFVPKENISGKVLIVLWPITDLRLIGSAEF